MTQTAAAPQKSTIVRMFKAPLPIRAAFRTLDTVAPGVSARWAERLWFTLPPTKPLPHAPGGERFVVTVDGNVQATGAAHYTGQVAGTTWGDGPVVYLAHGWAGHSGQFTAFVEPLVARGLRVVTFDMPSHGDSAPGAFGPRSTTFPEFTAALLAVARRYGPPHAVVAHSAGAIATAGAICDGLSARRLVLVAPMAGVTAALRQFVDVLGGGERTYTRLAARSVRRVGAPLHHFELPELGRAVQMPPTLVIHDRGDVSTPVGDGAAIAAAWPRARLHVTDGLGHNRILRDPGVVAMAAAFITEP
jgi:pimeloyl-ACP methyl ester carboxylesterase